MNITDDRIHGERTGVESDFLSVGDAVHQVRFSRARACCFGSSLHKPHFCCGGSWIGNMDDGNRSLRFFLQRHGDGHRASRLDFVSVLVQEGNINCVQNRQLVAPGAVHCHERSILLRFRQLNRTHTS